MSSFFSGCILDGLTGTSFTLESWSVTDDEGFPALSITYTCSGLVTLKLYDTDSTMTDTDYFFKGTSATDLYLSSYMSSVTPGKHILKAYNKDNNEIFSKTFSFKNLNLLIVSCDQKWWIYGDTTILIGLTMSVYNSGNTPVYPVNVTLDFDTDSVYGLVLPCVIMPGEIDTIECTVYKEGVPKDDDFAVTLKDSDGYILGTGSFDFEVVSNVDTKTYTEGVTGKLSVPYPEFLFDYYSSLERIIEEDYSAYVFSPYDDIYLDIFIDRLISTLPFERYGFNLKDDAEKINFVAKFVQYLEYKEDTPTDISEEYPNYPVETIFNRIMGCDCEDKAILTANLLYNLDYDVVLLRLPNHMAIGVQLSEDAVQGYSYYTDDYYYLETTTGDAKVGFIPSKYRSPSELSVYDISLRPLVFHDWLDGVLTIYTNTELGDFVKVTSIVENLGLSAANDIEIDGVFRTWEGIEINSEGTTISSLGSGMKKKVTISVDIPKSFTTEFETRIYLDDILVDTKESSSSFP